MKKILIAALVLCVAGCSTNPVPLIKASNAPTDRIFNHQLHKDGYAQLIVIRDSGITGSGCYAAVFVNGEKSALLKPSEKTALYLPPGEYEVGAASDGAALCAMGKERQERTVVLKVGGSKVVRVYTDGSGNIDIKPSTI